MFWGATGDNRQHVQFKEFIQSKFEAYTGGVPLRKLPHAFGPYKVRNRDVQITHFTRPVYELPSNVTNW